MGEYFHDEATGEDVFVRRVSISRYLYTNGTFFSSAKTGDRRRSEKRSGRSPPPSRSPSRSPESPILAAPIANGIDLPKRKPFSRQSTSTTYTLDDLATQKDELAESTERPFLPRRKSLTRRFEIGQARRTIDNSSDDSDASNMSSETNSSTEEAHKANTISQQAQMSTIRRRHRSSEFEPYQLATPRKNEPDYASDFKPSHSTRHNSDDIKLLTPRSRSSIHSMGSTTDVDSMTDTEAPSSKRRKPSKFFDSLATKPKFSRRSVAAIHAESSVAPHYGTLRGNKPTTYEIGSDLIEDTSSVSQNKVITEERAGKEVVLGGTMEQLVSHFIYNIQDLTSIRQFVLAKDAFVSPYRMLKTLVNLFQQASAVQSTSERTQVQIRIINFIKKWLSIAPHDFKESSIQTTLNVFLDHLMSSPETETWSKLLTTSWTGANDALDTAKSIGKGIDDHEDAPSIHWTSKLQKLETATRTNPEGSTAWKSFELDDVSPEEFARQWTLVDYAKFSKIGLLELLAKRWEHPDESPHVVSMNKHFNRATRWAGSMVVKEYTPKKRAKVLTFMINLAEQLIHMRNYYGAMSIIIGISQTSITRLTATWDKISSSTADKWKYLETVANPISNFRVLRALQESTPSHAPLILAPTILFRDLLFIEEGNEEFLDQSKNILNFEKIMLYGKVFDTVHHSQSTPYPFKHISVLKKYISHLFNLTEDEILKVSKTVEPQKSA
jgi:hypothetical protein